MVIDCIQGSGLFDKAKIHRPQSLYDPQRDPDKTGMELRSDFTRFSIMSLISDSRNQVQATDEVDETVAKPIEEFSVKSVAEVLAMSKCVVSFDCHVCCPIDTI